MGVVDAPGWETPPGQVYARVTPLGRWSWFVQVITPPPPDGSWIEWTEDRSVLGSRERADRLAAKWVLRERRRLERLRTQTHEVRP